MKDAARHLDKRLLPFRSMAGNPRPPKGWVRAIRNALGMTTAQLAARLGVSQPRAVELEQSEAAGGITLKTLERAAEALGCRVVYALVPLNPLEQTLRDRARALAQRKLEAVEHTMRLEEQAVHDKAGGEQRKRLIEELLRRPARLWDDI